ncbi:MAG: hypothetical protein KGH60_00210 [Candidatus Micrarchaeota archaeon]|nr:hypothetical protein [Candidatus Micrarchaeota archaeon]
MRTKKELETELQKLKAQVATISGKATKERELLLEKAKAEDTSSGLFALAKYMIDENKRTTMILKGITDTLSRLEQDIGYNYQQDEVQEQQAQMERQILPVSDLDAKIIQFIQIKGMACADDIRQHMSYRGRNAASARLNRLFKQGVLERYQLGHKVYYKYDAGKATNILIVSPPQ